MCAHVSLKRVPDFSGLILMMCYLLRRNLYLHLKREFTEKDSSPKNEKFVIYSPSIFFQTCMSCWTQNMLFWSMLVSKQLMVAIDFHSMEKKKKILWRSMATVNCFFFFVCLFFILTGPKLLNRFYSKKHSMIMKCMVLRSHLSFYYVKWEMRTVLMS